jgi:hypothetical protein
LEATANKRKAWWNPKKESAEERTKAKEEEAELRSRMLDEHIASYNDKFLEMEDCIENRFDSLVNVQDSVLKEREQLEKKLSVADITDVIENSRSGVLLKWLKVTLGVTTRTSSMEQDDESSDCDSANSGEGSLGKPFTLFEDSTHSMAFDDSVADKLHGPSQLGILGEEDKSDASDDDDLLY